MMTIHTSNPGERTLKTGFCRGWKWWIGTLTTKDMYNTISILFAMGKLIARLKPRIWFVFVRRRDDSSIKYDANSPIAFHFILSSSLHPFVFTLFCVDWIAFFSGLIYVVLLVLFQGPVNYAWLSLVRFKKGRLQNYFHLLNSIDLLSNSKTPAQNSWWREKTLIPLNTSHIVS